MNIFSLNGVPSEDNPYVSLFVASLLKSDWAVWKKLYVDIREWLGKDSIIACSSEPTTLQILIA